MQYLRIFQKFKGRKSIGALPNLEKILANARGRGITVFPCIQDMPQLITLFGKQREICQTIRACCDNFFVLGGSNNMEQLKELSDLCGTMTTNYESRRRERKTKFTHQLSPTYTENITQGKRQLINPEELREMNKDKMLVINNGVSPILLDKFDYSNHPAHEYMTYESVNEHIPTWRIKTMQEQCETINAKLKSAKQTYLDSKKSMKEIEGNHRDDLETIKNSLAQIKNNVIRNRQKYKTLQCEYETKLKEMQAFLPKVIGEHKEHKAYLEKRLIQLEKKLEELKTEKNQKSREWKKQKSNIDLAITTTRSSLNSELTYLKQLSSLSAYCNAGLRAIGAQQKKKEAIPEPQIAGKKNTDAKDSGEKQKTGAAKQPNVSYQKHGENNAPIVNVNYTVVDHSKTASTK